MKKPRMQAPSYYEPERRPVPQPAHRTPEPRAPNAAVIEKRPVIFNPSVASVSDYPPLPQRRPVQSQPPKPESVKTVPQKPVPVKTLPQQAAPVKTVPQKVEPAETVQQVEPARTAQTPIAKQEAKPAQKQPGAPNSEPKPAAADAIQNADVASEAAAAGADGRYQLDALAARALEDELDQIMLKVGAELPARPAPGAERLVVGKLAAEAGRDIKNALGLNVTKRLLNQHNPLYVKLAFSGKPEAGRLQPFLAAWRLAAFARLARPGDTFAARLDAAADFDRLCAAGDLTCGSAKVTVTPCYKFLACPSTVNSIYAISNEEAKTDSNNSSPGKQQNVEKTENTEAKTANVDKDTTKDNSDKEVDTTTEEAKSETPNKNTKAASSPVTVNIIIEAQSKSVGDISKEESKAEINNASTNKTDNNKVSNTPKEVSKVETNNASTNKTDINKVTTSKEVTKVETNNASTNKTEVSNKVTNQNKEVNKTKVKDNIEEMAVDEHLEDEEEMTDHDILALMSGGIVLDECSGSDDEE